VAGAEDSVSTALTASEEDGKTVTVTTSTSCTVTVVVSTPPPKQASTEVVSTAAAVENASVMATVVDASPAPSSYTTLNAYDRLDDKTAVVGAVLAKVTGVVEDDTAMTAGEVDVAAFATALAGVEDNDAAVVLAVDAAAATDPPPAVGPRGAGGLMVLLAGVRSCPLLGGPT
jgi:hypothetical protein